VEKFPPNEKEISQGDEKWSDDPLGGILANGTIDGEGCAVAAGGDGVQILRHRCRSAAVELVFGRRWAGVGLTSEKNCFVGANE